MLAELKLPRVEAYGIAIGNIREIWGLGEDEDGAEGISTINMFDA
jgi:hypothetical protein